MSRIDAGLLVVRVGIGLMFLLVHGGPKLLGGPGVWAQVGAAMQHVGIGFAPTFWGFLAALAEGVGGLCLILGLFTRPAAASMAMTMAVAATMHLAQGDGLGVASHAVEAGIVFLGLAITGPGAYSVQAAMQPPREPGGYTLPS